MEDSFLNLAHFHSRRAENHLKNRRFDEAIEHHKKTVDLFNKAIEQSSIPKSIECLTLQRKHHQNIQQIIGRQKQQFEEFLCRNGLKPICKTSDPQKPQESQIQLLSERVDANLKANRKDDEFFSLFKLVGDLKIEKIDSDDEMYPAENGGSDNYDDEFFSLR